MTHRNKDSRLLNHIGKRRYNFNFQLEKDIYCYLCCLHMKRKRLKKLDKSLKFNSYHDWKQYIWNKYKDYSNEELMEFSRYLNQWSRNIKPGKEYLSLLIPVIITLVITKGVEWLFDIQFLLSDISFISAFILGILFVMFFMFSSSFFIWDTFKPIWSNSTEENMLKDYKEIIDEMIKEIE